MSNMDANVLVPKFIERDRRWRSLERRWWATVLVLGAVSGLCALAFVASAVKPTPVLAFDSKGAPMFFADTTSARNNIDDVRVEYFVRQFVKRFVGINGMSVDQDLAEAINMMTPRRQQILLHEGDYMQRRSKYRDENIRSLLENFDVKIAPYAADDTKGKLYVKAWGRMDFLPRMGEVAGNGPKSVAQYFLTALVLDRQPVTVDNISGLLVDNIDVFYFDTEEDLKLHVMKSQT